MNNKNLMITIGLVVVVGIGAFFGGAAYGKIRSAKNGSAKVAGNYSFGGAAGGTSRGMMRLNGGGGFVGGQIMSVSANSITVQLPNGGSKIVYLSSSSQITKSVAGAVSDLAVGENVIVTGTSSADGSVTAQNIQIRPAGQQQQAVSH